MENRACAHCGEATLSPWKLALSGPVMAVRCGACGKHSTTATKLRAQMTVGVIASAFAALAAMHAWSEAVGLAILSAGCGASLASALRPTPALAVFPERSRMGPAMLAALVPTFVVLVLQWSDGEWTWANDVGMPLIAWWFATGVLIVLGAPIAWILRRIGREGFVAYAIAGAVPTALAVAAMTSGTTNPKPYLVACGLGVATAMAYRYCARRRLG